ncbi:hypothetical protein A2415_04460 [candidate division WWE3 bacterium RIFOXYC1_FULL_39_7]|uniref:Uncharacterized protein n=1 Tax=candidate division WWE3 bacterium RIFOXYC1_FULL_39_7 TaxID=1802643 RepID=A0A1F4WFT2_UNCKA|nr:MAG: hypothetical protein A2415_04460 [candidate division WWE3 bacterium RIFOXYC1_FULL_39_7]
MANDSTFVKVTNQDIFMKLESIDQKVSKINGNMNFHRKWLYGLSSVSFLIIGWIINSKLGG